MRMENIMRKICLYLIITFMLIIQSVAYAVPHNWQWIESDDEFGYFIDTANINKITNSNGRVRYAELWLKMKYTPKSAPEVLQDWGHEYVNANLLANDGSGIFKIKLDFLRGSVHVLSSTFLDKNGNILASDNDDFFQYVDVQSFYQPVFTYVANYIANTNDYAIFKNKKSIFVGKRSDGNNQKYSWIKLWRAHYYNNDENKIIVPTIINTYNSNKECTESFCGYTCYDLAQNISFDLGLLYKDKDENWTYYGFIENGDTITSTAIIPDTTGETIIKQLKAFKSEHNTFLHRLDNDGLKAVR